LESLPKRSGGEVFFLEGSFLDADGSMELKREKRKTV
jgi:hypothetical protein